MGKLIRQENVARAGRRGFGSHGLRRRARQRGVALFIALIVLVAMTLAAISLVRSTDTANVIAGNLAFKQATLNAGDLGVEAAFTALPNIISTSLETALTPGTASYFYYPTMRTLDANGIPTQQQLGDAGAATAIDWSAVPIATTASGYDVRYVVERLCLGPAPVNDIQGQCYGNVPATAGSGSKKAGATVFSAAQSVYYRVTVRVSGPRNTVGMVQAIIRR